jgi:endonuclease III
MNNDIKLIYLALSSAFPEPEPGLKTESCYELLISVILSAQTTDAQVNQVTGLLFSRFPGAHDLAAAPQEEVAQIIYSTGFYKVKARNIRNAARVLLDRFDGVVPPTIDELVTIPGVGRKSANDIVGHCFGQPAIIVDTHFSRVVRRIGLTREKDPGKIERVMKEVIPEKIQYKFSMLVYLHGQSVCKARKPVCSSCVIRSYCEFGGRGA